MEILTVLTDYLKRSKVVIGADLILVVDSGGGVVLASTAVEGDGFDLEALGSLAGGSVLALEQLIGFFSKSSLSSLTTESESSKLILTRTMGEFFLFVAAPSGIKTGYLKLKINKIIPAVEEYLQKFEEANRAKGSIDGEKLAEGIDDQLDTLFGDM